MRPRRGVLFCPERKSENHKFGGGNALGRLWLGAWCRGPSLGRGFVSRVLAQDDKSWRERRSLSRSKSFETACGGNALGRFVVSGHGAEILLSDADLYPASSLRMTKLKFVIGQDEETKTHARSG